MFGRKKTLPGNTRITTQVVCVPDAISVSQSSLGIVTNTLSPMSRGIQPIPAGNEYTYKWAGDIQPLQRFSGLANPIRYPSSRSLGTGAGVSGASSLPTSGSGSIDNSLLWMSMGQLRSGM